MTIGLSLLGVSLTVVAITPGVAVLAIGVLGAGAGAGVTLPAIYAMIPVITPPGLSSRATARVLLGWALSLMLAIPGAGAAAAILSWRGSFAILAIVAIAIATLTRLLPRPRRADVVRPRLRDALTNRSVILLLIATAMFMAAFYGAFAFFGTYVRDQLDGGPVVSSSIALAYGVGFAAASVVHRWPARVDRWMLVLTFGVLVILYASMAASAATLVGVLTLAAVWGFVNENALTTLVGRLTRARQSAAALALYNAVTYSFAAAGIAAAGVMNSWMGFAGVGMGAAFLVAVALVPLVADARANARDVHDLAGPSATS